VEKEKTTADRESAGFFFSEIASQASLFIFPRCSFFAGSSSWSVQTCTVIHPSDAITLFTAAVKADIYFSLSSLWLLCFELLVCLLLFFVVEALSLLCKNFCFVFFCVCCCFEGCVEKSCNRRRRAATPAPFLCVRVCVPCLLPLFFFFLLNLLSQVNLREYALDFNT
jgi:hypothetical protein